LAAVVAAVIPAAAKPAKPVGAPAAPADTSAPAAPIAARPRDAAMPMPILAGTEPQTAKPVEAAPSMTILFAQPAAQGAATLADAAAPALVAERVLDIDSDGAWIDQLARDIAATRSDSGDISFRLMPRHLGRLDVAMQMGDEGLSLTMDTHHEATATIVTAAQGRLVEDLRQQGVRVAGAEVTCTPGETGRQSQGQHYQGQGRTAAPDPTHLIETATERAEPRDEDRAADRRGRFA
jgi:flagellar hook-length control protein FliK